MQSVFEIVQSSLAKLTPAEKKAARVLMADYPAAGLLTVAQLGERAGVSGQTVLRLASTLGFSSYPQFQKRLIEELKTRVESPLTLYKRRAGKLKPRSLFASSLASVQQVIEHTFTNLSTEEFKHAVSLLSDSGNDIIITGGRFSDVAAEYLFRHLNQVRPGTAFLSSESLQRTDSLVDVGRKSVAVVFDFRRYQPSTIAFATQVRERGGKVILFTDPYLSPIAKVAAIVLSMRVEFISPFDSILAAIAVVETLVAALLDKLGGSALDRIAKVERARLDSRPQHDQ
jgi:DNA-binding MurR/RpiR family transcriptional regulator